MELAENLQEFCPSCDCYFNCVTDESVAIHLKSKNTFKINNIQIKLTNFISYQQRL